MSSPALVKQRELHGRAGGSSKWNHCYLFHWIVGPAGEERESRCKESSVANSAQKYTHSNSARTQLVNEWVQRLLLMLLLEKGDSNKVNMTFTAPFKESVSIFVR